MLRFNLVRQIIIALCFAASVSAKAQTEPPQFMTVDGRLYDSTTPEDPLLDNSVLMRIQVLNPAKTCILYEEEQTISTLSSNGYFNVRVGSPTSGAESLKRTTNDSGNSMVSVFQNQSASISGRTSGGAGCSYTPTAGDTRYFRYIVTPSTTSVTSTLSPDMQIDSVPQSLVAETLQGMSPDDFVQINSDVTQAKANSLFGGSYTTLTGLIAGTSSLYLRNTTNGTVLPSRATDPLTPAAGQIWYDSDDNVLRYFDGTVVQTLSSGSADPTKLPLAGGTMAGAIDMATNDITDIGHVTQAPQRTFRLGVYTTAQQTSLIATPLVAGHEGTVWYNTTTNKLMFWDGTAEYAVSPVDSVFGRTGAVVAVAGDYTAAQITNTAAGNIAATDAQAAINELDTEKVAKAGDTMTGRLNMGPSGVAATNGGSIAFTELAANGTAQVGFRAPDDVTTGVIWALPAADGSAGQVLQTSGTGVLSWIAIPSAPVSSVFGRTGAVVAATSDYDANQIDNTAAGNIAATDVQAAINELDTEKVATTRAINTAAGSGLTGGGDLSADRSLSVNINGTTAETAVAGADEILIYDTSASALRKMTRTNFVLSEAEVDAMVSNNGYLTAEADTLASVTGRGASTATNITMNTQAQTRYADAAGGEYAAIQAPATIGTNYILTLPDTAGTANQVLTTDGTGVLSWTSLAAVGETNTASNQGIGGVGLYDAKSGVDLQFRNINAASNKVSVALDAGNKEVDINVNEANLDSAVIPNTAAGSIAATNVQAAINELDTEKVAKAGDTMTGRLNMGPSGVAATNGGSIAFTELAANGTAQVGFRAPDDVIAGVIWTLPAADGSAGQVLQTDGSGILSWITAGAASIAADSLDFDKFSDAMTLDASTDIAVSGTNVLSVTNTGTGNSFVVNDVASDVTPFVIDANGNVGVGTTTPVSLLSLVGTPTTQGLLNLGNTLNNSMLRMTPGNDVAYIEALRQGGNSWQFEYSADFYLGNCGSGLGCAAGSDYTPLVTIRGSGDGSMGIGTILPGTKLDVVGAITSQPFGTGAGETGQLILRELVASGTETAIIRAPDAITTSYVLTLPDSAGSASQVLTTNGAGILSWSTPSTIPAADSLDFTHFADSMTLDASTSITASGTNVLSVTNTGTGDSFRVNDVAADTTPFVIDAAGDVGIGVSVPARPLHVRASNGTLRVDRDGDTVGFQFHRFPAGNYTTPLKGFLLGVEATGADNGQFIIADYHQNVTGAGVDTRLLINNTGQIGIGTSVPGTQLDVAGAITSRPFGTGTGQTGQLIMRELAAGGTDTATIRAPDAIATSYALTLPGSAGVANQVLTTDGTGALSWTTPTSGVAADSLNFTDFADAMTLDVSTDIGVTGANVLSVTNSGTGNSFVVNDQAADTSPFVIDASGNVGIGTTAPLTDLHVRNSAGGSIRGVVSHQTTNNNYAASFNSMKDRNGAAVINGDMVSSWWSRSYDGTAYLGTAGIGVVVNGTVATNSIPTDMIFSTGSVGMTTVSDSEKMRITSAGNVGVGTTIPGTLLDVAGAITSRPSGTGTGQTGQLIMRELAAGGTDTATIRAPDAIATSYSLTLPATSGSSGQVLRTDGTGVLSWIDVSSAANTFINNGNSFAGAATLGTDDNHHLFFETNGTNRLQIYNDGRFEFGGSSGYYSGDRKYVFFDNNWIPTGDSVNILNDVYLNGVSALTGTSIGIINQMRRDSAANSNNMYAAHNVTRKWGVGTLTNGVGSYNEFENNDSTTTTGTGAAGIITAGSGTITNARSLYASMSGAGTVTNAYGLYIDVLIGTNKWGIYQNGASDQNYFAGSVGVGTSSPGAKLDIYGTDPGAVTAAGQLRLYGSATSGAADSGGGLGFAGHDGSSARAWGTIHTLKENSTVGDAASYMRFATRISGGAIQERVRISSTGALGIGTTVPETLLDVAGAITSRPHGTATGETGKMILRELAAGGTDTATIRAPDAISTSYSLTLPTTAGSSGQVLRTDGTGVLTWVNSDASIAADVLDFTHFSDAMTLDASTDIAATGTNVLSITNAGTGDSFRVNDQAADTSPFVIDASGNVGIGTTVPGTNTKLDVNGQIRTPATSIADGNVDFSGGNTVTTSFDCGSNIVLSNVRRGGSYTLVVTGTGTIACNFSTAAGGDDAATVSYRFQPANGLRTSTSHTIYSLLRVGDIIYISWITGFQ